jgi:cation transport ATPase
MTLSVALYVGYFEQIAESARRFLPFVLMGLATPIVFYSAMPILRLIWQSFVHRVGRMGTLLGIRRHCDESRCGRVDDQLAWQTA